MFVPVGHFHLVQYLPYSTLRVGLPLASHIETRWEWLSGLAYCGRELITAVKGFMIHALERKKWMFESEKDEKTFFSAKTNLIKLF